MLQGIASKIGGTGGRPDQVVSAVGGRPEDNVSTLLQTQKCADDVRGVERRAIRAGQHDHRGAVLELSLEETPHSSAEVARPLGLKREGGGNARVKPGAGVGRVEHQDATAVLRQHPLGSVRPDCVEEHRLISLGGELGTELGRQAGLTRSGSGRLPKIPSTAFEGNVQPISTSLVGGRSRPRSTLRLKQPIQQRRVDDAPEPHLVPQGDDRDEHSESPDQGRIGVDVHLLQREPIAP